MLISFIVQSFLQLVFAPNPAELSGLQPVQPAIAAEEDLVEYVKGVDEATGLAYSHTLPLVGDNSFGPQRIESNSLGLITTADSILVLDRRTKKQLYEKSADDVRSIASITKLMSAVVLSESELDFSQIATIQPQDRIDGGRIWVYSGEQFYIQDLWLVGLIASENVAIRALVREAGYTQEEFVQKMNEKAVELGMNNSFFVEPTGLNSANVSTANDLAKLLDAAVEKTEIIDAVRRSVYTFSPLNKESLRTVENTNTLLGSYLNEEPYQIMGGKTGFTYEAGYCLGVIADGPNANDEVIAIVLGADSITARSQEVKGLVDWTYRNYSWN